MNKIIVDNVACIKNRIEIKFHTEGVLAKFFNPAEPVFWTDYSIPVADISVSVAVIPFMCNVLPIAWLTNATIELPELDRAFLESIPEFKRGYMEMYPMLDFRGRIDCNKLTDESHYPCTIQEGSRIHRAAVLFSGGVDAFATLIAHAKEHPALVTLWGCDIMHDDLKGWQVVKQHSINTAKQFDVESLFIKTNFRIFINEGNLNRLVKSAGDSWWHGFQHGIGLLGHGAPISAVYGLTDFYIASSFTMKEKGKVTCASDPSIDNNVRYLHTIVHHDQYGFNRQEKINHIVEYGERIGQTFNLRVCWITSGGRNCCHCEKCLRTMLALFAEGVNPKKFGFDYTNVDLIKSRKRLKYSPFMRKSTYHYIQQRFLNNPNALIPTELEWFKNVDLETFMPPAYMRVCRFVWRIVRKIYYTVHPNKL